MNGHTGRKNIRNHIIPPTCSINMFNKHLPPKCSSKMFHQHIPPTSSTTKMLHHHQPCSARILSMKCIHLNILSVRSTIKFDNMYLQGAFLTGFMCQNRSVYMYKLKLHTSLLFDGIVQCQLMSSLSYPSHLQISMSLLP